MRPKSTVNLCSTADLSDPAVVASVARPFEGYLTDEFGARLRERNWDLVGLSVNYTSQLPVALRMARLIRSTLPHTVIVFGGTEVGDVVKYTADREAVWRVFQDADLIVPGEGETALIGILDAIRDGTGFDGIGGVMTRSRPDPEISYGSVAALAGPAYDVWDWDRYWSPEPVILYSPTRGCYWNKCTFCDYGLNTDRPTSPSRERPVPAVMEDLRQATRFGRTLYFAVDAMSPATFAPSPRLSPNRPWRFGGARSCGWSGPSPSGPSVNCSPPPAASRSPSVTSPAPSGSSTSSTRAYGSPRCRGCWPSWRATASRRR